MPNSAKSRTAGFTDVDVPDQSGKTFIVTGANSGVGFAISSLLAARRARVLLACRDKAKADDAIFRIRQKTPDADLAFLALDLSDLKNVRTAAELAAREPHVDVLINNAAVASSARKVTAQGFEQTFGVNHLGCFAFTSLLLPKLMELSHSRIIVTCSGLNAKIDWDDLNAEKSYKGMQRYAVSKLANMLFVFELDRRLRKAGSTMTVTNCQPGFVEDTGLARDMSPFDPQMLIRPVLRLFANTPAMSAWSALQAATGQVSAGGFYGPGELGGIRGSSRELTRPANARDPAVAKRLWDISIELTRIDPGLPSAD